LKGDARSVMKTWPPLPRCRQRPPEAMWWKVLHLISQHFCVAPALQEAKYEPGRPGREPEAAPAGASAAGAQPGAGAPADGGARGACERGPAGGAAGERPADGPSAGRPAGPAAADRRGVGSANVAAGSAAQVAPEPARAHEGQAADELGHSDRGESEAGGRRSGQERAPGGAAVRLGRPCGRRAAAAAAGADEPAACTAPGPVARAEPGNRRSRERASKRARVCA